jgi:AmmeMemoRadiSam system protein B
MGVDSGAHESRIFLVLKNVNFPRQPLYSAPPDTKLNYVERMIALDERVRSPILDGLFYPEDTASVLAYMQSIGLKRGRGGLARAIIAPHGAWEISGTVAGAAFASACGRTGRKSPSRVVIMGPLHDNRENSIFLSDSHSFQTPLGSIAVDQMASGWLESYSPLFKVNDIPHLSEHSIEILLPFVKYCFPHASIVPILMGQKSSSHEGKRISVLAHALRAVFEPIMADTLIVISFNLIVPPGGTPDMAEECVRLFSEGKHDELRLALQNGAISGCGSALFAALLQSGLLNSTRPRVPSKSLLSAKDEQDRTIYYSAFSFE